MTNSQRDELLISVAKGLNNLQGTVNGILTEMKASEKRIKDELTLKLEGRIKETEEKLEGKIKESEERTKAELRGEIKESEERLEVKIQETEQRLEGKIKGTEERLEVKIQETEERLAGKIKGTEEKLRGEIKESEERVLIKLDDNTTEIMEIFRDYRLYQGREHEKINNKIISIDKIIKKKK